MSKHTEHSRFREKLIEHLFVGELLKLSWQRGDCTLEVASPEVDNSGYDIIAEDRGVVRHIQLKASYIGGTTARQKIHTRLADKSSGCMVWIYFDESTLSLGPFLYFGGSPGEELPSLDDAKTARQTNKGVRNLCSVSWDVLAGQTKVSGTFVLFLGTSSGAKGIFQAEATYHPDKQRFLTPLFVRGLRSERMGCARDFWHRNPWTSSIENQSPMRSSVRDGIRIWRKG